VVSSDITFIEEKFQLNQQLVYLPESFKKEADSYMKNTGRVLEMKSSTEIYEELVIQFSQW